MPSFSRGSFCDTVKQVLSMFMMAL